MKDLNLEAQPLFDDCQLLNSLSRVFLVWESRRFQDPSRNLITELCMWWAYAFVSIENVVIEFSESYRSERHQNPYLFALITCLLIWKTSTQSIQFLMTLTCQTLSAEVIGILWESDPKYENFLRKLGREMRRNKPPVDKLSEKKEPHHHDSLRAFFHMVK